MTATWHSFRQALAHPAKQDDDVHSPWYTSAIEQLIEAVQELSHARDLDTITDIVRQAARNLTGADGATFVLRDGNQCYYADENAITPLWKGRRFPMEMCISGWVMLNAMPVVIKDIYNDSRIPTSAYRPTFVKSLAMVPIRRKSPIGAIGNYWATHHETTDEELAILQALADTTSVALENVDLYMQLKSKLTDLEVSNHELSCFAWAASHDLQEPLRTITAQVELLKESCQDKLDEQALQHIRAATQSAGRLQLLIGELVLHARSGKKESFHSVHMSDVVSNVLGDLKLAIDECGAKIYCSDMPSVMGNQHLLECLIRNLLSNAIKFRVSSIIPQVQITSRREENEWLLSVKDNGPGIASGHHQFVFGSMQNAHAKESGIGLATCKNIVELHRGRIWVESFPNNGSNFCFTLPVITP